MENSELGTSTSSTLEGKVFLSFRGPDTYDTFTRRLFDALHHAEIGVFINEKEIQRDDVISVDFMQPIDNFMIYIPIFSKNYASSPQCLRELVMMVKSYSESKEVGKEKAILPIFYDVEPDDVKLKTNSYKEAILKLVEKKNFDLEEVETWRQALKDVGHHKGLNRKKGDDNLIKLVVQEVLVRLKTKQRQVTENLVGMEDHKAAIDKILDIDSDDVRIILIYGMGGIGKTTLANIIFNQLYPNFGKYCSFLDDVRERAKTKGLVEVQKQLLSDISSSVVAENFVDIDSGIRRIGETIGNKKALIVLDDVGAADQIKYLISVNSLYAGTRILVTSRDKSVLDAEEFQDKCERYEMPPLKDKDALELFCWCAFGDNSPPANYRTLSEEIVHTMKGLPLALQVIGSSLSGVEEKEKCEEKLEELKKTSQEDVQGRLRISYNDLKENHQRIFLDIACFFIGEKKICPMYMWRDCEYLPNESIAALTKRCMVKVSHDGRFWMHDHLRDLGRTIATQEHRRLWNKDDTIRELKETHEDEERVEGLRLSASRGDITITSDQIKRFPRIRFLSLSDVDCQGDFTDCLEELRWIRLSYGFVSPEKDGVNQRLEATTLLYLENVVVVDLCGLQFEDDVLQNLIQRAWKLKVLVIRANFWISGTPIFREDTVLEKLIIHDSRISEIHRSIGRLQHLTELSVNGSLILKLPKQIGRLRKLRHLSLKSCHHLVKLPDSVSELESLTTLDVYDTKIEKLPPYIGKLPRLSFLDLSHAPIAEMPRTTSQLSQLQTLKMFSCNRLQELPMLPRSLTTLVVTSKSLLTLPDLSYLTNLVELVLSDNNHVEGWSGKIQTGELWWIGRLSKLSKLSFRFPTVRAPTTELSSLYQLKELTLQGVDLPTFEQIPSNLTVLELYDSPGKQVQLDGVPQLEKETDTRGKQACTDGLPECKELQAPELADHRGRAFLFPRFQKALKKFRLSGFSKVHDIRFDSTFESLEEFHVQECSSLKSLGGLSYLKNLKELSIESCESLQVIEGIDKLEFLHRLHISGCRSAEVNLDASSSKIPNKCSI